MQLQREGLSHSCVCYHSLSVSSCILPFALRYQECRLRFLLFAQQCPLPTLAIFLMHVTVAFRYQEVVVLVALVVLLWTVHWDVDCASCAKLL